MKRGILLATLLLVSEVQSQCLYDTLAAAVTPAVGDGMGGCTAGGMVADGGSCTLTRASHTCSTAVCTGTSWNSPTCTGYCEFDSLTIAPATASGANCNAGGQVPDGQTCTISRVGYTCTDAVCSGTTWNTPTCTGNPCNGGPTAVPANTNSSNYAVCSAMISGDTCSTYICDIYYHPTPMVMLCDPSGNYDASVAPCDPNPCNGGPYGYPDEGYPVEYHQTTQTMQSGYELGPPTAIPGANWAGCNALATGATCDAGGFNCSEGWTGTGTITLYCDDSGNFNASGLTCEPNTCQGGPIMGVAPHTTASEYAYCNALWSGVICEQTEINYASQGYVCDPGYRPEGDFKLVCSEMGGTYDATGSDCTIQNCMDGPTPQTVPNNTVATAFAACNPMQTGDICAAGTWTCDPGYTPQGDITLLCEGYYNVTGATCVPNTCTTPSAGVPANTNAGQFSGCSGRVTGEICGDAGGYTCDATYTPVGDFTLICDASGNYDATGSSCLRNPCDLGPNFPLPDHTSLQSFGNCSLLEDGDTCSDIICDAGYTLSGSLSMSCVNRRYDVTGVTCDPNPCSGGPDPDTLPANSTAASFSTCTGGSTGTLCSNWTCDTGYVASTPFYLFCNSTNMYSAANARCIPETPCNRGGFAFPGNATSRGRLNFVNCESLLSGDTCTTSMYTCDDGYKAANDFVMECVNGYFNTSEAVCEPNDCSGLVEFPECSGLKTGDECEIVSCPAGYETSPLQQNETLSCNENGTSVENITCYPGVCSGGPVFSSLPQFTSIDKFSYCTRMVTGDSCVFGCDTGFQSSGTFTLECINGTYTVPNTVSCVDKQCTVAADCTGTAYASGVVLNSVTGECTCTCRNGFSGPRCGYCDPQLFDGSSCDRCSTNAVGYPNCRLCSLQNDCNNNAASVMVVNNNCECTCKDKWSSSSNCQTCPSPYGGIACNECDPTTYYVGYPNCDILCTDASFCSSHGTAIQHQQTDSCSCQCSDDWSGDMCDVCSDLYYNAALDSCNSCAPGRAGYPLCRDCATVCSSENTLQIDSNGTHCLCQCKQRYGGEHCTECAEGFMGAQCDICADGFVGPNCQSQCSILQHCRGNAVSVTGDGINCVCTCAGHWTGSDCSTCPERFAGTLCNQCSSQGTGYIAYPECTPCSVDLHCNNRATAVRAAFDSSKCECTCKNQWSGDKCELCKEPYSGTDCDTCLPGYINYPTCTRCTSEIHCNSRGNQISTDGSQSKCICSSCDQPFTGEGCNIRCDKAVHCNNHATTVVAENNGCKCQCMNGWQGDSCDVPICSIDVHCSGASHSTSVVVEGNTCKCQCKSPWSGADCSIRQCTVSDHCTSSSHASSVVEQDGDCLCTCTSPWTGSKCSAHTCTITDNCNSRASFSEPNAASNQCECKCIPPWTGSSCEVRGCTVQDHCNGMAQSVELVGDTCICNCVDGYEGDQCQTVTVVEKTCSVSTDCNNRAATVQLVNDICVCNCNEPYSGTSCSVPLCSVSSHCNGKGISATFNENTQRCVCSCNPPYEGDSCERSKCSDVVCSTPPSNCQVDQGECNIFTAECDYINKQDMSICSLSNQVTGVCISGKCIAEDQAVCGSCAIQSQCETISSCTGTSCDISRLSDVPCDDSLSHTTSDRCVDGTCIGVDISCDVVPEIAHAVINCNSASAFGQTCTVGAETGYTCHGTALCTKQSAPHYESNIQCTKQCRVSDIPKPYVATGCGGEFFSGECSISCPGNDQTVLVATCLQGVVDVPRPCENCLISTFTTLRIISRVDCVNNNFHCTITGINSSVVCDTSSGSCSDLSPSTCKVTKSTSDNLCDSYVLQNGNYALCNSQQTTLCITANKGYRCTSSEATSCQQLETVSCNPETCDKINMRIVNMNCVDCAKGEVKNSITTRTIDGDTSCELPSSWKRLRAKSDSACNDVHSELLIRITKNGWSEYAKILDRSICDFINGAIPSSSVTYAFSPEGPWQLLQVNTSKDTQTDIGAMILPSQWLQYDPRTETNTWSPTWTNSNEIMFEYLSVGSPPAVKEVLRVLVAGILSDFKKQPFVTEIFRLLSTAESPTVSTVDILFACPFAACPASVCPETSAQRLAAGCKRGDDLETRSVKLLQSDGVWIDFIIGTHEGTVESREAATKVLKEEIIEVQGTGSGSPNSPVFISPVTDEDLVVESPQEVNTISSPAPTTLSESDDSFPIWLIALIAAGSLLCVCLVCLVAYCYFKKKKSGDEENTAKRLDSVPSSSSIPSTLGPSVSQVNEQNMSVGNKPIEQNPISEAFPRQLSSQQPSHPNLY
eukprot:TRINITY_DN9936_c2_g1_i3.p1 TRINITY_DN9936_c2_g1~~TRINITY_DN9936_c2_g1_i3.p1  ORF type:complete len:2290 (+),score=398.58 TRINITY_DN9936_c2_g1_i3:46-6915(+)